jgi:hypothetical protein
MKMAYFALPLMLLAAMVFAAACGDDDDDSTSSGSNSNASSSGATGSDEKFVADICKAGKKFSDDLAGLGNGTAQTDPSKILSQLSGPFQDLANAFRDAKPPSDLKQWHEDASDKLDELAKGIKDGKDLDALDSLGEEPFPEPPAGAADRLQKVAEKNQDCKDADFSFGDDSGD